MLQHFRAAPLSSGFFFFAILGFLVSALYYQFGKLSDDFAFSFMLIFGIMFVASLISMRRAPIEVVELKHRMRR